MIPADVDPERFEREWRGDQDVLRSLAEQGDRSHELRKIDVSFRGEKLALDALAESVGDYGFEILDWSTTENGGPWLFLDRMQPADAEAIRGLTIVCLQIERRFGVDYDGWGCMGQYGAKE